MEKYAAVVLAAGKGTRMNNGDSSPVPKVMFEIKGKPVIRYSVDLIKNAGIEKVVLIVGYMKEMVEDFFDGEVEYAVQEEQLGTGHAVMQAEKLLKDKCGNVIIFYGDCPLYKPETIKKLMAVYEERQPTIAMLSVVSDDPTGYGRIIRDANDLNHVAGIVEHKDCTPEQLKIKEWNPGFYIFDGKWLWENINKLSTDNVQHEYYLTDLIGMAVDQDKRLFAMPVSEENEALGINTLEQLKEAEVALEQRNVDVQD